MIELLLLVLIALWFFNYIHVEGLPALPNIELFAINGHPVTLFDILILVIISWVVSVLPSPFRQIAVVFVILWVLSVLGILGLGGFSSMLILSIIGGLILYIFTGPRTRVVD